MFYNAVLMRERIELFLYLCRAEISATVAIKGLVCPFLATK